MSFNDSRHHFPLNSMLFTSTAELRAPLPANATLVNINEAADRDVTALPAPPVVERKPPVWARLLARIKQILGCDRKKRAQEMEIGGPADFQHHVTGGAEGLRNAGGAGRK